MQHQQGEQVANVLKAKEIIIVEIGQNPEVIKIPTIDSINIILERYKVVIV